MIGMLQKLDQIMMV